jgi:hypothetical protein
MTARSRLARSQVSPELVLFPQSVVMQNLSRDSGHF